MNAVEARVRANGLDFRVLAAGPEQGALAVLLHGFPEGAESWLPQLDALATVGRRAVAPDLRGYGGSDCPPEPEAYALPHLIDDVAALVAALGRDRCDLAGHDWGALLGWAVASRRPDLLRTWTALSVGHPAALAAATGLDGRGGSDPDQQARSSYVLFFQRVGRAEEALLENGGGRLRAMYRLGPNPDAIPAEIMQTYINGFQRPGRMTAALNYYRANLVPDAYSAYPPCPDPIRAPTMLIWGEEDPALGRRAVMDTAALVAGPYRLEVLQGAGHWLQFERSEEIARLLVEQTS